MKTVGWMGWTVAAMVTAGTVLAGNLTPPGAPGSTMHTLTDVHDRAQAAQTAAETAESMADAAKTAAEAAETRTAITNLPWTISQGGSYYLAATLSGGAAGDGITVTAPDVTLDLNGFALLGAGGMTAGDGIVAEIGAFNLLIVNGTVVSWGAGHYGINSAAAGTMVEGVRLEVNDGGIMLRDDARVANCTAAYNGAGGGILVRNNGLIENCRVLNNDGRGIYVTGADTVLANNTVRNNSPDYDLHAATVQVPSAQDLQQQLADTQQQIADLKRRMGAFGMAETVGGMVLIPAGDFEMGDIFGDGSSNEQPMHTVFVSAFYMDQYEVTQAQWDEVYTWATTNGYTFDNAGSGKGNSHPVHTVNWYDCVKWANARSERDGLTPVYYTDAAFSTEYKTGTGTPHANWSANGYRLPTEAEWEKAARGGAEGRRFPWAAGNTISHTRANYSADPPSYDYDVSSTSGYHPDYSDGSTPHTSPVGSFAPNGYGLYDMAGNVWEWCWDWFSSTYYSSSPVTDPRGPASGSSRVRRGGSWISLASSCRVANRYDDSPGFENDVLGFRLVRAAQ